MCADTGFAGFPHLAGRHFARLAYFGRFGVLQYGRLQGSVRFCRRFFAGGVQGILAGTASLFRRGLHVGICRLCLFGSGSGRGSRRHRRNGGSFRKTRTSPFASYGLSVGSGTSERIFRRPFLGVFQSLCIENFVNQILPGKFLGLANGILFGQLQQVGFFHSVKFKNVQHKKCMGKQSK